MSLNAFAISCDVEPASISRFINGKSGISFKNIIKIANRFGQTPAEFLTEFEQYNPDK